eukprot:319648-Karenia_brevis.AAC.1
MQNPDSRATGACKKTPAFYFQKGISDHCPVAISLQLMGKRPDRLVMPRWVTGSAAFREDAI